MQRVAIVGLGLIGGSIGLGLRRWSEQNGKSGQGALEVIGFDTDLDQQHFAKKIGAVDSAEWELGKAIRNADLVVVCTPVRAAKEVFADIAPHLKSGAVVTDTGSTKEEVLAWAEELLPRTVSFVGGHPMAGKAQSIEGAEAELFKGVTWCVTPAVSADDAAIRNVLGMIAALGAEPYFLDPGEHDAYVAGISHLPFVLAATLMNALAKDPSWRDMKSLTAGGFRDMTRLAAASPDMHRDIAVTNREAIKRWIDQYLLALQDFRASLDASEDQTTADLTAFFTQARDARAEWATQTTREGELLQGTQAELSKEGFGDQMGRMLFGGFMRRRVNPTDRLGRPRGRGPEAGSQAATQERENGSR
ncbi:MAG TPA: prephenate dehydrogenase/arogenate dehydrogenase family protein [Thermomicrobiales bacterium]|nr:prephenate dehydrogenase/arogenate dehydrogenase family protein [Thermomicrobiales bacterium]